MTKFKNTKKERYLKQFEKKSSLLDKSNDLASRCKFNFSYFISSQKAGQEFRGWNHKQLYELLEKIRDYTAKPINYWRNQRAGGGGLKVLETYGVFPPNSEFTEPAHIPIQAEWGRFRLGSKIRLIGFTLPADLHQKPQNKTGELFDKNTFYVVFLDKDHKFYRSEAN